MLYDGLLVEYLVWATLVDTRVSGIVGVGGGMERRVCRVCVSSSLRWLCVWGEGLWGECSS